MVDEVVGVDDEVPAVAAVLAAVDGEVALDPAELGRLTEQVAPPAAVDARDDVGRADGHGDRGYVRRVRVIAGSFRGRPLVGPKGTTTRPTSGRVREATFNALTSMGAIEGSAVLDLFAGSGALGIEALSRGAERCTFVEHDRDALEALATNLARCRAEGAQVRRGDAVALLASGELDGPWDLALVDPPYAFDGWNDLLSALQADLAVCEAGAPVAPPEGWVVAREKAYGGTVVTILQRTEPQPMPPQPTIDEEGSG